MAQSEFLGELRGFALRTQRLKAFVLSTSTIPSNHGLPCPGADNGGLSHSLLEATVGDRQYMPWLESPIAQLVLRAYSAQHNQESAPFEEDSCAQFSFSF